MKFKQFIIPLSLTITMPFCNPKKPMPGTIKSVSATSTLKPSGNYDYKVDYLFDGSIDTSWVEGKADDGIGEGFTITLDKENTIDQFSIHNGFGVAKYWKGNNRIRGLKISAGEAARTVTLADQRAAQAVKLSPPLTGTEFRFTVESVYKGSNDPDTAVAEISFPLIKAQKADAKESSCNVPAAVKERIVTVLSKPGGKPVATIPKPDEEEDMYFAVTVTKSRGDWLYVKEIESAGRKIKGSGWVRNSSIVTGVDNGIIKLRSKPGKGAVTSKFDVGMGAGEITEVLKCSSGYVYIEFGHGGKKHKGLARPGKSMPRTRDDLPRWDELTTTLSLNFITRAGFARGPA